MKKSSLLFMTTALLLLLTAPCGYAAENTVQRSDYQFTSEYDPISLPSYLIDDQVYVPLRIFAKTFNVTVDYDAAARRIDLDFGTSENSESELAELTEYVKNPHRTVRPTDDDLFVQGNKIELPMLLVGDYNFLQIDTIAEGFGLRAVVDTETKTIGLTQDDYFGSPYLPQFEEYLKDHQIAIDTADTGILTGTDFDDYNVYLVGEQHAIAKNFEIQLYFIKYFNQHQNVRYIISEDGFCGTMLLNRYLETGDASIIQNAVEGTKGSFAYSKNYYEFYEKLYEYNKTLPEDKKLFFVGIDVQHSSELGADYLLTLFKANRQMPEAVAAARTALSTHSDSEILKIPTLLEKNQTAFREYFGTQFDAFRFGLRSVEQGIKFHENDDFELREDMIHQNFRDYYQEYGMEKCYGMFGGAHTLLNGSFDEMPNLASYINNEYGPTKGKVCSIMTNYINCFYMDSETGQPQPVNYSQSVSLSRLLDQIADTDLVLFPLAREGSPFVESKVTDGFQYYLCVKNSPAATPFGPLGDN